MILLEAVREILRPQGYSADTATMEHYPMFEGDLDDADEYELSRTHYQDWRKALQATFLSKGAKFVVKSEQHEGALIFGVTPFPGDIGRIWMLQSRLFVIEAYKAHGRGLPYKMGSVTSAMIDLFLWHHPALFNFIPRSQTRNIRWLQQGGFQFFHRTDIDTDIVFFGQGDGVEALAANTGLWDSCLGVELTKPPVQKMEEIPATDAGWLTEGNAIPSID